MASPLGFQPLYREFRTFDKTYVLKIKNPNTLLVRVMNLAGETLQKKCVLLNDISFHPQSKSETLRDIPFIITRSIACGDIDEAHQITPPQACLPGDCEEKIRLAIEVIKRKVSLQDDVRVTRELTCPISYDLFTDPVTAVPSGITYSRHRLDEALSTNPLDPVAQIPVTEIVPNRTVADQVERIRDNAIPNLGEFEVQGTPEQIRMHRDQAVSYATEGHRSHAEQELHHMCTHTKNWRDYEAVVSFYEGSSELNDKVKFLLARLYLARYQLLDNQRELATQNLIACLNMQDVLREAEVNDTIISRALIDTMRIEPPDARLVEYAAATRQ